MNSLPRLPVISLFAGSFVWGLLWYPYRMLEQAGVNPTMATFWTYGLAAVFGALLLARMFRRSSLTWRVLVLGVTAGWTNLAYVVSITEGEVMRVMLLFYLAPLWTIFLARIFLKEKLTWNHALIMGTALAGAFIMLTDVNHPWPIPQADWEWIALSAGVAFALANVFTRMAQTEDAGIKALSGWVCVSAVALLYSFVIDVPAFILPPLRGVDIFLIILLGVILLALSLIIQHGLTALPANLGIVIFISELVVAAIGAYFLAGEAMSLREMIGGAFIVTASLVAARNHQRAT